MTDAQLQPPPIDPLWDYDDPAGSEERFRALLDIPPLPLPTAYRLQLLAQIARTYSLRRRFAEAHTLLDQVQAEMTGGDLVEVRFLLERGRAFNSAGEREQALPLFRQAFAIADTVGEPFYAVDALHMLAIAAPPDEQLSWNLRAVDYALASGDNRARGWLASLYNNIGWTYFDRGEFEQALAAFRQAFTERQRQGNPDQIRVARWSIGRALRALGELPAALLVQRLLEEDPDHSGFVEEELAEILLALGRAAEAAAYFATAHERLSAIPWVAADAKRVERLRRLAQQQDSPTALPA